jgi:hypothetical protein
MWLPHGLDVGFDFVCVLRHDDSVAIATWKRRMTRVTVSTVACQ